MKIISICALLVLTGCQAVDKNKDSIKSFAHDVFDEGIDDATKKIEKKSNPEKK